MVGFDGVGNDVGRNLDMVFVIVAIEEEEVCLCCVWFEELLLLLMLLLSGKSQLVYLVSTCLICGSYFIRSLESSLIFRRIVFLL